MSISRKFLLAGFLEKTARILTTEEAAVHRKKLINSEALRRVNTELTKKEKILRKEKKYYENEYPSIGDQIGFLAGSVTGLMAGSAVTGRIADLYESRIAPKLVELAVKRPILAGALGVGSAALGYGVGAAAGLAIPVTTGVAGSIIGHKSGDWIGQKMITQKHRDAEDRYQQLWDKHRYDPELQSRVSAAVERLKTASEKPKSSWAPTVGAATGAGYGLGKLYDYATQEKAAALNMTPQAHQSRVADRLNDTPGLLVYHGLGSGKTFSAINAAEEHNLPILAITPASLRENFKKEVVNSGFMGPVTVMSYEEATNRSDDPSFREQASQSLLVFDEAHRMGRSESKRSRLTKKLHGAKTMLLTGTPMRNRPEELMPLLGATDPSLRIDPKEFKQRFIAKRQVHPGFWASIRGVEPGLEETSKNMAGFRKMVEGKVDYHKAYDPAFYPESTEEIIDVKMTPTQTDAYNFVMNKYPSLAYKIKHGIPPGKKDMGKMQSFLTGPRQIANTPAGFAANATPEDSAKIMRAVDEIVKYKEDDKNFRGVVYSTYLGSGIDPMAEELERRGVDHVKFTGQLNDAQKKQVVTDYNTGKTPVLLVSGAGAEGLDLKGTKLMQILEPHWNEELINQVKGRAIRYQSHAHLPEDERKVTIQRFHSQAQPGKMMKLIRAITPDFIEKMAPSVFGDSKSADQYLYDMSMRKQKLNESFLNVLKGKK